MTTYKFLIVDDHPLFRGALTQILTSGFPDALISEAGAIEEVASKLDENPEMDLVLLDLNMPGVRGFSGLMLLRAQHPGIPICIVSGTEDSSTIRRCIEFGASGFIPKSVDPSQIKEAINVMMQGGVWTPADVESTADVEDAETSELVARLATLTPQQVRVLMMLSEGLLNKQIAYELSVSEATVKAHVSAILQKLNVESRTQAVIAAAKIEAGSWQNLHEENA